MEKLDQARLQAILHSAVDGIVTIDAEGVVQSVNPAVERIFGYSAAELLGRNVSQLMPSPDRERHDSYLADYLSSGQAKIIGMGREVVGRRKDGSLFPLELAVSEVRLGDRVLFTGIVRDITHRKQVERRLQRLNKQLRQRVAQRTAELQAAQAELLRKEQLAALGKVAGGIAHEIRNPLNAIKTSAYFLLHAHQPSPEKVREHLQRIDRQVTLADQVVTTLVDFAKLPAPAVQAFDLRTCLEEAARTVTLDANQKLRNEVDATLPRLMADPAQISIALRNLLRNARDAMPDGGTIIVRARLSGADVETDVVDQGVGISPEMIEKIMQPFFSTKARGMGLGLAITESIVARNQGRLHVQSEAGRGSTFTIRLPAEPSGSVESST